MATARASGWGSYSDGMKAVIAFGVIVALVVLYAVLKYVGVVLGIALFLHGRRQMKAAESRMETEGALREHKVSAGNWWGVMWLGVIMVVVSAGIDAYTIQTIRAERQVVEAQAAKKAADRAEVLASLRPGECAELKHSLTTFSSVEAECHRMYDSDSWRDSMSRAICVTNRDKKMEACGVKYYVDPTE